jgi:hypothetical protein
MILHDVASGYLSRFLSAFFEGLGLGLEERMKGFGHGLKMDQHG